MSRVLSGVFGPDPDKTLRPYLDTDRYVATLTERERHDFAARIRAFIEEKEWVGSRTTVTTEMKVRIAAAAVQVTFGLEPLLLLNFRKIVVHPAAYYERRTGQMHKGGTAPMSGVVHLAWDHFVAGFADPGDAVNLGLHEMAHAIWFENRIHNGESGFLHHRDLAEWNRLATVEIAMINAGESRLFRRYAGTNEAEFFACAVEYFFEQAAAFKEKMPAEYAVMCRLLKQDPASVASSP